MSASDVLAQGLTALGIALAPEGRTRLMEYVALIEKWNRTYNLTSIRGEERIVTHHLLDSLAVAPHIGAGALLDVGSGAGLPGIPLAIAGPERAVTLLDASAKRASFLRQAVIELGLRNAQVVCERVEAWEAPKRFDVVISRAFSDLVRFVEAAGRLCSAGGVMAAMRGRHAEADTAGLPAPFRLKRAIALKVPGLNAERHLVLLEPGG